MKRSIIVIVAFIFLAMPAICSAAPPRTGHYVSVFLGIAAPRDADVTGVDFIAPPTTFNETVEFDTNINVGATAGYDLGILRLEGELSYKHAGINSVTDKDDGFRFRNVDGDLGVLAMMFNGFFDLHNPSRVTPYLGGGIGFAALYLSNTTGIDRDGIRIPLYLSDDDTVFAYQAGAGLDIALNRQLSLDLGYRYFGTSKATFGANKDITTDLSFESHNAAVGLRLKY